MDTELKFQLATDMLLAGRTSEAKQLFNEIIGHEPKDPDVLYMLGAIANQEGRNEEAVNLIGQAVSLDPKYTEAHHGLGNALKKVGQLDAAIAAFRLAIELEPNYHEAYNSLGCALKENGQNEAAINAFKKAIILNPDYADAYNNLGNALRGNGQGRAAIAAYRQFVRLKPDFAGGYNNLGIALTDNKQLDSAIEAIRKAIALDPNYAEAYSNLGAALKDMGRVDEAIAALRIALKVNPNLPMVHSNLLMLINFHPDYDSEAILKEHVQWDIQHALPLKNFIRPHTNNRETGRRLRIGYSSSDLNMRPIGRFLLPLLENHNHRDFEIIAYSSVRKADEMTDRLRACVDNWFDIAGLSDSQAADKIRDDGVDILVDLSLHLAGNRMLVFSRKPAPVQVCYLGHTGTTGLRSIDYRFSDQYIDPPGENDEFYVEKTIRLPQCYCCYQPLDLAPPVNDLPAIAAGFITFGSMNNFCKVNPTTLELWATLLRKVPRSRLIIYANSGSHQEEVRRKFAADGVDSMRIDFFGTQSLKNYFSQYSQIDIALDPFPYGGGTTTCDALWMGVPVVTMVGRAAVGHGGLSFLNKLGLTPLIAHSRDEYIAISRDLAADIPRLFQLRRELRKIMQNSDLMDARQFAFGIESAYRKMWIDWCNGKAR